MNAFNRSMLLQVQAIRELAVKQRLAPQRSAIKLLPSWRSIRNTCGAYFDKLFKFLFSDELQNGRLQDEYAGLTVRLQIIPADVRVTVSELIGRSAQENEMEIDWLCVLPWESMLSVFWQRLRRDDSNLTFAEWLTSERAVYWTRMPWSSEVRNRECPSAGGLGNSLFGVLIAWSQSSGQIDLQPNEQLDIVVSSVNELQHRLGLPLDILPALENPSLGQLCDAIANSPIPIYILHLIAHGVVGDDGVGRLLFAGSVEETASYLLHAIDAHRIKHGSVPAICVLNACSSASSDGRIAGSSVAETLASAGIPYVVANQAGIRVAEVRTFNSAFYAAIGHGHPVHIAVNHARRALAENVTHSQAPRSLPPLFRATTSQPALLRIDEIPGWAVPVLYMHADYDGTLPGIQLCPRILWPLDGKVMVLIRVSGHIFYVDECPVTVTQFRSIVEHKYTGLQVPIGTLVQARAADDGAPMVNVRPGDAQAYAAAAGKRMLTFGQWCAIATMDSNYSTDGIYLGSDSREVGNIGGTCIRSVRNSNRAPHQAGIWDYFGNTYELVQSDNQEGEFIRVSSSFVVTEPIAFDSLQVRITEPNRTVGFRTAALLSDVLAATRNGHKVSPLEDT